MYHALSCARGLHPGLVSACHLRPAAEVVGDAATQRSGINMDSRRHPKQVFDSFIPWWMDRQCGFLIGNDLLFFSCQICDVLCCIVFVVLYWTFSHEIVGFEERADNENVTPADYAMEVIGIPEDAQDEVRALYCNSDLFCVVPCARKRAFLLYR